METTDSPIMTQFGMIMEAFFTGVNGEDWRLDFSNMSSCDVSKGSSKLPQKRPSGQKKEGTQLMTFGKGGWLTTSTHLLSAVNLCGKVEDVEI